MTCMSDKAILGVEIFARTGLYHGTHRAEDPTPSGSPRWTLTTSTTDGFRDASGAARAIHEAFPHLASPSTDGRPDLEPLPDLDAGFRATRIKPVDRSPHSWETPSGTLLDTASMDRLVASRRLVLESSSGRDPELSAVYDHFEAEGVPASA
jgi:hypothetical protein